MHMGRISACALALALIGGNAGMAQAQSSTFYAYCVAQPGNSRLITSDVFSVREGDDWYNQRNQVRSAFSSYLNRNYDSRSATGITCHFHDNFDDADYELSDMVSHRRDNGWSVNNTGWGY